MQLHEVITKYIDRALTAVRLPFRARLTRLETKTPLQLVQGEGLASEQLQSVELLQQFGFTSGVPTDSQLVVLPIGGKTVHAVVVATENSTFRIQVEHGETAIYNQWGAKVVLKKEKIIEIDCEQLIINASKNMTVHTEHYTMNGSTCAINATEATAINTPAFSMAADGQSLAQAKITADLQLQGDMKSSGTITSDGDQIAAGVSQSQHTHSGVSTGSGSTGTPT